MGKRSLSLPKFYFYLFPTQPSTEIKEKKNQFLLGCMHGITFSNLLLNTDSI